MRRLNVSPTPLMSLPAAGKANAWLGALGMVLASIYMSAIIVQTERRPAGFGADSLLAIGVFVLGMWGLQIIAG
jgi:cation:H+ antiporter